MANRLSEGEISEVDKAFQQFMLTGKKSPPPNKATQPKKQPTPSPRAKSVSASQQRKKQIGHQVQLAVDAFHKVFVHDWLPTDDQLCQVVESIANLRERVWVASRAQQQQQQKTTEDPSSWMQCGFRGSSVSLLLTEEDVDLGLSHSLLAHERMLAALRHGLSHLSQAQDALGRRLEEVLATAAAAAAAMTLDDWTTEPGNEKSGTAQQQQVEECLQLHRALSVELYRKQVMGQSVLDSTNDGILWRDDENEPNVLSSSSSSQDNNPRSLALKVSAQWPRNHHNNKKASNPLFDMVALMNRIEQKVAASSAK